MYLTPYADVVRADLEAGDLGLIVTPQSHRPAQFDTAAACYWAADNGCFTLGDRFDLEAYLAWLEAFDLEAKRRAMFATAPDVVGDWAATWARSEPTLEAIRAAGFPAAIVLQDGATVADLEPHWARFDAVFVGGSTEWKLGSEAAELVEAANARGLWSHMGRVNSVRRMVAACRSGCYSVDGTMLLFGPAKNRRRLAAIVEASGDFGYAEIPHDLNRYADPKKVLDNGAEQSDGVFVNNETNNGAEPVTTTQPFDDGSQDERGVRAHNRSRTERCRWCDSQRVGTSEFCLDCRPAANRGNFDADRQLDRMAREAEAREILTAADLEADFLEDADGEPGGPALVSISKRRALATFGIAWGELEADGPRAIKRCRSLGFAKAWAAAVNAAGIRAEVEELEAEAEPKNPAGRTVTVAGSTFKLNQVARYMGARNWSTATAYAVLDATGADYLPHTVRAALSTARRGKAGSAPTLTAAARRELEELANAA